MSVLWSIVPALWVGSLWTIGYLVAPALFAGLEDRALAGNLAGRLFTIEAWLSLACGGLLLLSAVAAERTRAIATSRFRVVVIMLALIVLSEWVFGAMLGRLRAAGHVESPAFAVWHGAAALSYLAASVLGLFLLTSRHPAQAA